MTSPDDLAMWIAHSANETARADRAEKEVKRLQDELQAMTNPNDDSQWGPVVSRTPQQLEGVELVYKNELAMARVAADQDQTGTWSRVLDELEYWKEEAETQKHVAAYWREMVAGDTT